MLPFPWRDPPSGCMRGCGWALRPIPPAQRSTLCSGRVTSPRPFAGALHAPLPPRIFGGRAARSLSRHPPMLQGVPLERGQERCGDCSTGKGEGAASPAGGTGRVSCAAGRGTTVPGEEEGGGIPGVGTHGCAAIAPTPAPGERRSGGSAPRTAAVQHRGQQHFSTADSGGAAPMSAGGTAFHLPPSPRAVAGLCGNPCFVLPRHYPSGCCVWPEPSRVRCAGEGSSSLGAKDGDRSSRDQGNDLHCKKSRMRKSSAQPVLLRCLHVPENGHPAGLALQRAHTQGSGGFAVPHRREAAVSLRPCSFSFPLLQ